MITPLSAKINGSIRKCIAAITGHTIYTLSVVIRYSYWFLSISIFFSCQKTLTQTDGVITNTTVNKTESIEQSILIDTSAFANRVSSLLLADVSIRAKIQKKTMLFYQSNDLKIKWMEKNTPGPLYYSLMTHLKNAAIYGLDAAAYHIDHIEGYVDKTYKNRSATANDIIDADILVTEIFLLFTTHLREGRPIDPGHRDKMWIKQNRIADSTDIAMLVSAKNSTDLDATIKRSQPADEQYAKLQQELIRYRSLENSEIGPLSLSAHESIQPGDKHLAIPTIRKKLWLMEIVHSAEGTVDMLDSLHYDQNLVVAVKMFQLRHGLQPDGIVGRKTLSYLNQSFKEKADLIALNMERRRWKSTNDATHLLRVNLPEFKLYVYEEGHKALEMNVIVGAVSSATPVFTDTLEHVVFSPTWTVPPSIVKDEFLPRLKKNRTYYADRKNFMFYKNGVKIDPSTVRWDSAINIREYRIVQSPGPDNALGLAKFIMPNDMNIYLHDTPDHSPFSDTYRALSHGCIRLDDPARLAAYLLRGETGWDLKHIKNAMTSGNPTKVPLKRQYQVQLEYYTAWVNDKGELHFRDDIYGHDKRQLERLHWLSAPANYVASR